VSTTEPGSENVPPSETAIPSQAAQAPPDGTTEGDEPEVERAETLRLPMRQWVLLWAVPVVVAIAVLVIVIAITNP
jgi:hypothetical protein